MPKETVKNTFLLEVSAVAAFFSIIVVFLPLPRTHSSNSNTLGASVSAQTIEGDADSNGIVNLADYAIWEDNYNERTRRGSSRGDFNGDRRVTGVDYMIWRNNYGSSPYSTPTPLPSPTPAPKPWYCRWRPNASECQDTVPTSTPTPFYQPTVTLVPTNAPTATPTPTISTVTSTPTPTAFIPTPTNIPTPTPTQTSKPWYCSFWPWSRRCR